MEQNLKKMLKLVHEERLNTDDETNVRIVTFGANIVATERMENFITRLYAVFEKIAKEQKVDVHNAVYYMMAGHTYTYGELLNAFLNPIPLDEKEYKFVKDHIVDCGTCGPLDILEMMEENYSERSVNA